MKRLSDNQNHQNRPINVLTDWWQQAGIGIDLSRIFVLILLALGTGFIFNTVFLWPRQSGFLPNQPKPESRQITLERAHQLIQRHQAVIVDTRPPGSYAHKHIAGALNLSSSHFKAHYPGFASQVDKNQTVILYCGAGCHTKESVAERLRDRGYQDLNLMTAGVNDWAAAGYPVATGDDKSGGE